MSSYVDSVLSEGERIVYRANVTHWKYFGSYLLGVLLLAGGATGWVMGAQGGSLLLMALAASGLGLCVILVAVVRRNTTELVLTDRRIITKRGFLSRSTVEMNLSKVESLQVNQGLMGRMFNFGDVSVVGTGSSLEPLHGISNPLELRKKLGSMSDAAPAKSNT
ncbi:MAG: PH domain-containing protein [Bdellovibrionales bacterium]|nr:PH domain-containing protein [Ramlibacter sp.]